MAQCCDESSAEEVDAVHSRETFGAARLHRIVDRAAELRAFTNERLAVLGHGPVELPSRPERALVGFDGQRGSVHAARWAGAIASELELVTVLPTSPSKGPARGSRAPGEARELLTSLTQRTKQTLESELDDVELRCRSVEGEVARELRRQADGAGLLAIGYHNQSRGGAQLGSIAKRLVREAPTTTLLAENSPEQAPVSAGIGEDAASRHAAAWATALALWMDRPLQLYTARADDEEAKQFEAERPKAIARRVNWPPSHGFETAQSDLGDLLAIGHRGVDMGIGSVALELARRCKTSVLVSHPP